MNTLKITTVLAFAFGSLTAFAAERSITQKDKTFSESAIEIKKGDTVIFVNDDTVVHNIMSNSPANTFNLGALGPGTSTPMVFKTAGEVAVICAIHPRMKMTVKVND